MKFDIWEFSENLKKIQASLKSDKNNGYFTERTLYMYDISLNSLRMRNKSYRDQNLHFYGR
jgi:hypothetical protein